MRSIRPALFVLGLSLAGCSTAPAAQTVVREEIAGHRLLVQLEPAQPGVPVRFAHPVTSSEHELAERLDTLLAELAYGRPKGRRLARPIELEDRQRLAAALARGLTHAGPRERVRFLLSVEDDAHTPWLTPDDRQTRGIAFVDLDGRFHLAFDLLDDRVAPDDVDPYDPTERAQTRARLVTETGEDLGPADDGAPRLWVAWRLLADPAPATAADDLDANTAKLELLNELLRDGIIDREEYERRRAPLGPRTPPTSPKARR
ncbi:hypothetical protein DB30_07404 [Enhygromyxa salina]|uniref:SHOCT domain-containing protein n=1 Tax=Enhygromyxa salina TaxID=215803 RepID=A0A0C1ZSD3_9BACT|nr:SHOCT domain-containing protein [Enhygromyxa salina]KIG13988.1 hypothetical protein DB30_07404 [Enhygromyxa salina]